MATAARPDVTVTVIVYNDAERLPRAVASLRNQTLRNIEIIISDDHSTDNTPQVARELAAQDDRIVYHRLAENSGGCSAPRNEAMEIARAPYLMFLDSDDELPADAVESLFKELRDDDTLDFAMGGVERVRTDTGEVSYWHPHLFGRRRIVRGIAQEPGLLFEHLSTNKLYRRAFIDRHTLRFPLGIHYEDQLWSAQAYMLARAFAVLPQPVYRWYISPYEAVGALSISNQRHRIENVRDRVNVAKLIDAFMVESGHADLKTDKDFKFLKHDLRMYTGDLPYRDPEWIKQFRDEVDPYLDTLAPEAFQRLPRDQRVVIQLVRDGRYEEAQLASRGMGRGVAPREVVTDGTGRTFWGSEIPADPDSASELEITDLDLRGRPFRTAMLRHEITRVTPASGSRLELAVRTYDPGNQLPMGPAVATVHVAGGSSRLSTSFRLDPVRPGLFEGTVVIDLAAVPLPKHGFAGVRHPVLALTQHKQHNTSLLLAPLDLPRVRKKIGYHGGVAEHLVTVEPEGHGAGRLQIVWERTGLFARVEPYLPALRRVAGPGLRTVRGLAKGLLK
ncbi:glycosyltransferase family 2 protein [Streptomyces sp. ICBB 8177]|uniref:glycosyltransferase family 2 protein n=1 Tax=Streptomyces sp. ICBB 8177 TaxID=563922 RepID=UPI000D6821A4|nr:glycosyltransferase family 2 protein [Streptomyces sp. ICBB 8177]PWI44174.1 transferase [Streptomyces sp. ICBB 8177]